jgi:hypothetical protein
LRQPLFLFAAAETPVVFHLFLYPPASAFHYDIYSKEHKNNYNQYSQISLFHHIILFISRNLWLYLPWSSRQIP